MESLVSKSYVALNRHSLRAKIAGLAFEGRALRAPLRRPSTTPTPVEPSAAAQSKHRRVSGPNRVWLRTEAHQVGVEARLHLLAYAYLYRHGFACVENPETTRTPIDEAKLVPLVMHHLHIDKPTWPEITEFPTHAAQREEHTRRKIAYDAEIATFKEDLVAAIRMTNTRIAGVRYAWTQNEWKRAELRAARSSTRLPKSMRPTG